MQLTVLIDSSQSFSPAGFNLTNSRRKKKQELFSQKSKRMSSFLPPAFPLFLFSLRCKIKNIFCHLLDIIPFLSWSISQSYSICLPYCSEKCLNKISKKIRLVFREYTAVIDIFSWYIISIQIYFLYSLKRFKMYINVNLICLLPIDIYMLKTRKKITWYLHSLKTGLTFLHLLT